jgi:hypothetical protein
LGPPDARLCGNPAACSGSSLGYPLFNLFLLLLFGTSCQRSFARFQIALMSSFLLKRNTWKIRYRTRPAARWGYPAAAIILMPLRSSPAGDCFSQKAGTKVGLLYSLAKGLRKFF